MISGRLVCACLALVFAHASGLANDHDKQQQISRGLGGPYGWRALILFWVAAALMIGAVH